ncbi:MAG TPA: hypothetical protein DHV56_17330 [Rhodobacter sp.]|nr:hypothetical protein [Rhodobacter sp.]
MAVDLGMGVDTRITASLHPQSVASLDEYDSDTEGELQQVVQAFTSVYEGVGKVLDVRDMAVKNTAWSEDMRTIKVQEMADRAFAKFAPQLDKAFHNMRAGAELIEKQLSAPVEARAAHSISAEIRAHVKGLAERQGTSTLDKRPGQSAVGFVQAAIQNGDAATVTAVLGAPAYLSGIDPKMQEVLLRQWHEKANPVAAKRLRAMRAVMDLIQDRAPLIHMELERVVGKSPAYAKMLRDKHNAAEKALGGI